MSSLGEIKEKLKNILNGEKSLNYLNNITQPLGNETIRGNIISGKDGVNCFLINIFREKGVFVDIEQNNNSICDLIIYGKKVITRTLALIGPNKFYFGCFSSCIHEQFNIDKFMEKSKERINNLDYILLLIIDRSKPNEIFRVSYNFYLKSIKDFIDDDGNIKYWTRVAGGMYLHVDKKNLGEPLFTYSYNYE